jgi:hypothetical protein
MGPIGSPKTSVSSRLMPRDITPDGIIHAINLLRVWFAGCTLCVTTRCNGKRRVSIFSIIKLKDTSVMRGLTFPQPCWKRLRLLDCYVALGKYCPTCRTKDQSVKEGPMIHSKLRLTLLTHDTAQHTRRPESSARQLSEPQISHR